MEAFTVDIISFFMPPCINFGLIIAFSSLISPTVLRSVMLAQSLHPSAPRDQLPLEFGVVSHRRRSVLDAKPDQAIESLDQIVRPQKAAIPPQEVPHTILIQAARSEKLAVMSRMLNKAATKNRPTPISPHAPKSAFGSLDTTISPVNSRAVITSSLNWMIKPIL